MLFPKPFKIQILKEKHFYDVEDIQENVASALRSILIKVFEKLKFSITTVS